MQSMFAKWALCLSLVVSLFACQDHQAPVSPVRYRLKKLSIASPFTGIYLSTVYSYNNAGKVAGYTTYNGPDITNVYQLTYDGQNRLISSQNEPVPSTSSKERLAYDYDAAGKLTTIRKYGRLAIGSNDFSSTPYSTVQIDYGGSALPLKVTEQTATTAGTPLYAITTYSYTGENITTATNTVSDTPTNRITTVTGRYDNKINPRYGFIFEQPTGLGAIRFISKNNIITTDTQQYTYNSDGLPVKETYGVGVRQEEYNYEYEAY